MKYHTKEETTLKYKEKAVIKRDFFDYMKNLKVTIFIIALYVFGEIFMYLSVGFSMCFVQYVRVDGYDKPFKLMFDFAWTFNSANVTITANRLNFIVPNGEGSLEWILQTYLKAYANFWSIPEWPNETIKNELISTITNNSILVWRMFTSFLPAFIGIITMIWWIIKRARRTAKGEKLLKPEEPIEMNTQTNQLNA